MEILSDYAKLARTNALQNNCEFDVEIGSVSSQPTPFYNLQFHHVIMNPPYFAAGSSSASPERGRASGKIEQTPLSHWCSTAAKRLRPKGYLTLIQRVERLPDVLAALEGRLGSISVQPLAPHDERPAHLVLIKARKSGRAEFQLLPTKSLHLNKKNKSEYKPEISAILRDGSPFKWNS